MSVGPKLLVSSVFAIFGLGCSTQRELVRIDQPTEISFPDAALQDGRPSFGSNQVAHIGKADTTTRYARGTAEVPAGLLDAKRVDRSVKLSNWFKQDEAPTEVNPSGSADLSSLNGIAGDSILGLAVPASPAPGTNLAGTNTVGGEGGGASPAPGAEGVSPTANAVSGNPAATNIVAGSGRLGELLGINRNGIRFGGLNITDANGNLAGGLGPGKWTGNTLTIADLSIDLEKFAGWKGGLFGTEFLYYDGFGPGYSINGRVQGKNDPNALAGTVMGYNSLSAAPPFSRAELYELWFRQEFFNKKLIVRIGKSVPTYDFNNVVQAIPARDQQASIPAISSALFTPLYVNPTLLGVIPGYYNSATGIVASLIPTDNFYLNYGFFDGNLARGEQTGFDGPRFNGYYLHLVEGGDQLEDR